MIGVSFLLVQPLELLAKFNGTLVLLSCSPECQWSVIQQETSYFALQISPLIFVFVVKQIQLGKAILTFPGTSLPTRSNFFGFKWLLNVSHEQLYKSTNLDLCIDHLYFTIQITAMYQIVALATSFTDRQAQYWRISSPSRSSAYNLVRVLTRCFACFELNLSNADLTPETSRDKLGKFETLMRYSWRPVLHLDHIEIA